MTETPTPDVTVDPSTGVITVNVTADEILAQLPAETRALAEARAHNAKLGQLVLQVAQANGTEPEPEPDDEDLEDYMQRLLNAPKEDLARALADAGLEASTSWSHKRLAAACAEHRVEP